MFPAVLIEVDNLCFKSIIFILNLYIYFKPIYIMPSSNVNEGVEDNVEKWHEWNYDKLHKKYKKVTILFYNFMILYDF